MEISLIEIINKIKSTFWVLIVGVLISALFGYLLSYLKTPYYESDFTVKIPKVTNMDNGSKTILSPVEVREIIKKINQLLLNGKYKEISLKLKIKNDQIEQVRKIIVPSFSSEDVVYIRVEVYSPSVIPVISQKVVDYLNNNNYVKNILQRKKEILNNYLGDLKKMSEKITENKFYKDSNRNMILVDPVKSKVFIDSEIKKTKMELSVLSPFKILADPVIPKKPSKPIRVLFAIILAFAYSFIYFFFVLINLYNEKAVE